MTVCRWLRFENRNVNMWIECADRTMCKNVRNKMKHVTPPSSSIDWFNSCFVNFNVRSMCRLLATLFSRQSLGTFEWNHILNRTNALLYVQWSVEWWVKCVWQFVRDLHPMLFVSPVIRSYNQSEFEYFLTGHINQSVFGAYIHIRIQKAAAVAALKELMATRAN